MTRAVPACGGGGPVREPGRGVRRRGAGARARRQVVLALPGPGLTARGCTGCGIMTPDHPGCRQSRCAGRPPVTTAADGGGRRRSASESQSSESAAAAAANFKLVTSGVRVPATSRRGHGHRDSWLSDRDSDSDRHGAGLTRVGECQSSSSSAAARVIMT